MHLLARCRATGPDSRDNEARSSDVEKGAPTSPHEETAPVAVLLASFGGKIRTAACSRQGFSQAPARREGGQKPGPKHYLGPKKVKILIRPRRLSPNTTFNIRTRHYRRFLLGAKRRILEGILALEDGKRDKTVIMSCLCPGRSLKRRFSSFPSMKPSGSLP
jgi:hypothetical protein